MAEACDVQVFPRVDLHVSTKVNTNTDASKVPTLMKASDMDVYWKSKTTAHPSLNKDVVYPDKVIVTPPSEDLVSLKNPLYFSVDTSKAGPGKLTAKCEIRESGKEVKAVVAKRPKEANKFTVSVNPDEEGDYSVSILFNEHHVKGSPFDINLVTKLINESQAMSPITSPPRKTPLPTELQTFIGEPFSCVIGQENFEHLDNMTATAVGMKTGPVEIVRKQNEEDLPCFFCNPDVADKYTIEIQLNGSVISGNSFIVDYIYPVDASKCVIFGADGLSEKLTINETISFGVDASRAGNGKLSVNVDGPSSLSQPIEVSVTSTEENPNVYHISYLPTARGKHSINLQWAGEPIPDSPIILDVDSSDDIPTLFTNEPFVIHFTTDCDPKEIESYAIHEDTCHRYVLKIGKRKGGKLNLILYAKELGIHSVHILICGKEIHGSPYKVLFIESDPIACKIIDIPKKPPVGMETSFKVDARNAGYGDLHIKAKVPHGGRTDITHVDHKNGTYSVVLTPIVPGNHTFQVSWAGVEIPDSPVVMEVVPAGPDLLASLEAASRVYIVKEYMPIFSDFLSILEPAVFHLNTKHAGKGQLTIRATGPYEARIKVVDQNDGTYKCDVHPKVSGKYLISILWNDFSIPGSPFHLNFTDGKSHMIHGFKLETDYFTIGTPREYIIDCGKEQGSLKVDCHPKEAADVELTSLEGKDNTYLCKIIPQIVGNHEIHVTYNEKHILNSPYAVQFCDVNVDASKVKPGDLHVPGKAGNNQWVWLELDCNEAGCGDVTAEAKYENGVNVEVDIKSIDDNNNYCVKFRSDQPGMYNLAVFYGGKPIPGSPYSNIEILNLSSKSDKVEYLETRQPEERGGAAVLLFDAKEAGKGEFRARVAGLRTSHNIEHSYELVPGSDHIYRISFQPHLGDKYLIDVYWDDHAIPKSPFFVELVCPDEVIVTPPSEDSLILNLPFHFDVDTSKAGPGKLTAKCEIRESSKEVKAVVAKRPKEANKFTVSVNPDKECVYSVSILFNKHHVKGSPFDVDLNPISLQPPPINKRLSVHFLLILFAFLLFWVIQ